MVKSMKKLLLTIYIIGALVLALFVFVLSGAFAVFMPAPTEPKITYGEFPFIITCEINNEIITYRDVVICEYEGIESWGTAGKRRKWSTKLKSGKEHIVLLQSAINNTSFEIYVPIPGEAKYYMGEIIKQREEYERVMKDDRYLGYKQNNIDHSITKEEAWEKYRIKIVNIECSSPIENKFE